MAQADNYDGTIFAFTKIMWLQDPVNALRCMLMDQAGFMSFDSFLKQLGSQMAQTHLRFWVEAQQILMAQGPQQVKANFITNWQPTLCWYSVLRNLVDYAGIIVTPRNSNEYGERKRK